MPHRSIHEHTGYLQRHGLQTDLLELGLFQLLSSIGQFLIMISLPYYLFANLQYSIWQVCLFFAWWSGTFVIMLPFVGVIIRRTGIRHAIALRSWIQAFFWLLLPLTISSNFWLTMGLITPVFLIPLILKVSPFASLLT